jgi:hypothetical protein
MFKFITRRSFLVNLLVAIALLLLIVFIFFFSLGSITKHNESVTVPSVTGKSLTDATAILKQKDFDVSVQDSVYIDTLAPLTVVVYRYTCSPYRSKTITRVRRRSENTPHSLSYR